MTNTEQDALPLLRGDFYGYEHLLSDDDRALVRRVRDFAEQEIAPVVADHWARGEFPHELIPKLAELDIVGLGYERPDRPAASRLLSSFVSMELARVDASFATFFGVHSGLAMGSIVQCGSDEQRERWLPEMFRLEKIGAFALTEPTGGSDVARGLRTTAKREGDEWVLNGAKRWIGNATFADYVVIYARDLADNNVKGFVVEKGTPGFHPVKIENKVSLRTVQNAEITLTDVRVPEANRLQNINSFKDVAKILRFTRTAVSWMAVGVMVGAYEHALEYAKNREQFGRPIAKFQMIQDLLVKSLANITASWGMVAQLARQQDAGVFDDAQASLAKLYATARMREVVTWCREICGGNGIVLDYDVARYMADSEAIYSFEGTYQMQTLIVGKAITGHSAFV